MEYNTKFTDSKHWTLNIEHFSVLDKIHKMDLSPFPSTAYTMQFQNFVKIRKSKVSAKCFISVEQVYIFIHRKTKMNLTQYIIDITKDWKFDDGNEKKRREENSFILRGKTTNDGLCSWLCLTSAKVLFFSSSNKMLLRETGTPDMWKTLQNSLGWNGHG